MPVTQGQGNPDWSTDETLLVLDLLLRNWPKLPGSSSPDVRETSEILRRLQIHLDAVRNEKFRNPDGVYMKLQNLASLHPDRIGVKKGLRTSRTDRAVWRDYAERPDVVRELVREIVTGADVVAATPPDARPEIDEESEAPEGTILTRVHRIRERHRGFRKQLRRRARPLRGEPRRGLAAVDASPDRERRLRARRVHLPYFFERHAPPSARAWT